MANRRVLIGAGTIVDEPTVRKWAQLQYLPRPRFVPLQNPLRSTATAKTMSRTKQKSGNELVWRAPNALVVPEDWKRYEMHIKTKNGEDFFRIKFDTPGQEWYEWIHIKWAGRDMIIPQSFHNKWVISQTFRDYNKEGNKYKPVRAEAFWDNIRSDNSEDPLDEKFYNEVYASVL